jgi:hypothetical protein
MGAAQNGTAALTPVSELYKLTLDGPALAKPGLPAALRLVAGACTRPLLGST